MISGLDRETANVLPDAMAFGKPHQSGRLRHVTFVRRQIKLGLGEAVESVVHELLDGGTAAVDSVLSKLPKNCPDQIASFIEAGVKGRLRLLAASETPSSQK